jgi:hypothetical protein
MQRISVWNSRGDSVEPPEAVDAVVSNAGGYPTAQLRSVIPSAAKDQRAAPCLSGKMNRFA